MKNNSLNSILAAFLTVASTEAETIERLEKTLSDYKANPNLETLSTLSAAAHLVDLKWQHLKFEELQKENPQPTKNTDESDTEFLKKFGFSAN